MMKKVNLKVALALFMLGLMLFAPSFKVLADGSESTSTGSHQSEQHSESQNTSDSGKNSDSNHNGIADSVEQENERQIQQDINTQDGSAQIQSQLKVGNVQNSFQFQLEAKDKVEFSFHFKSESSSSHTQVEMKFEIKNLIEFVDNTTNPSNVLNAYDSGDTLVQKINFESLTWNMAYTKNTISNQTVYNIVVNATQGSMVVTYSFFLTTGFVNHSNYMLTPNAVKFNVEIKNFPFKDQNSLLASEVQIKNQIQNRQIENDTEDHKAGLAGPEQQLSFTNSSVGAFFSWAKSYLADGANKTVVVSPVTTENGDSGVYGKMYFNFAHANDIFWDPSVGVTRSSSSGIIASSTPGFEVLAILILPGLALISRVHKKKAKKN